VGSGSQNHYTQATQLMKGPMFHVKHPEARSAEHDSPASAGENGEGQAVAWAQPFSPTHLGSARPLRRLRRHPHGRRRRAVCTIYVYYIYDRSIVGPQHLGVLGENLVSRETCAGNLPQTAKVRRPASATLRSGAEQGEPVKREWAALQLGQSA